MTDSNPEIVEGSETVCTPEAMRAELQSVLHGFAQLDTGTRERQIGDVLATVHKLATPESIKGVDSFQTALRTAIQASLRTGFVLPNGDVVEPWRGAFTVVAIDREGTLLGGLAETDDEVYKQYGTNLFPYGLSKALIRLHLELAGRRGGLDDDTNYEYLRTILPEEDIEVPESLLFKGEAIVNEINGENDHPDVIIGATGCPLKRRYRETVAPGMSSTDPVSNINFLAGAADEEFSELVAIYMARPDIDVPYVHEQRDFSRMRRAH